MKISKSLIGLNLCKQLKGENVPEAAPALCPSPGSILGSGQPDPLNPASSEVTAAQSRR